MESGTGHTFPSGNVTVIADALPVTEADEDPAEIDEALARVREELSRSIRQGDACEALHERVGRMVGAYSARLQRPGELVFRVDALLVEYGCRPWSIDRRGLAQDAPHTDLAA